MLPSRVVVYLLLAGVLVRRTGLPAGLAQADRRPGHAASGPSRVITRCGRPGHGWVPRRCGGCLTCCAARPPRSLPGRCSGCGLLVCAIDGTTMIMPDSSRNLAVYGRQAGSNGGSGYPLLRLVALVTCGTRTVIDAVFGPASRGELDYARRLARSLHAGMLVLADRPHRRTLHPPASH